MAPITTNAPKKRPILPALRIIPRKISASDINSPRSIEPADELSQVALFVNGASIYVSGHVPATDVALLRGKNISRVLNCTQTNSIISSDGIQVKRLPMCDTANFELKSVLLEAIEFVSEAVNGGRAILVHCHAGISRSASVVIAYLMASQKMKFHTAFETVRSRRSQVCPNMGFCGQLLHQEETSIPFISAPQLVLSNVIKMNV